MQLTSLTLADAARLLAQRSISPVELTQAHLERIEQIDPLLTSFITVTAEEALRSAQAAEAEIAQGQYRGPLHGIPIALKDLFETRGIRTTAGSKFLRDHIPERDATVVRRLSDAGAISLGKLNMDEWAMHVTNINPHYGDCKNPWDVRRIPGGSSGGSAAALAAELCLGALGSDTACSIRIPAALCGVVGLKPTYGRCSTHGVFPLSWTLDHVGPMARRVRDVALLLQTIAGYDPADPYSVNQPVDNYLATLETGVRGLRVALVLDGFLPPAKLADPEVLQAVCQAARVFEHLGAAISEVTLPGIHKLWRHTSYMLESETVAIHAERVKERPEDFGANTLADFQAVARYTAVDYAHALHAQALARQRFREFFADYDLLLTPSSAIPAMLRDDLERKDATRPSLISFAAPFNFVGLPALSVPCGFSADGLPIGLQIVAQPWAEALVLRAGYAYEQATEWHLRKPAL